MKKTKLLIPLAAMLLVCSCGRVGDRGSPADTTSEPTSSEAESSESSPVPSKSSEPISSEESTSSEESSESVPVEEKSLTMTSATFPAEYNAGEETLAVNDISFGYYRIMGTGGNIQFSSEARDSGYLWNIASLGEIRSIEVKAEVNQYYGVLSLYLSNEEATSTEGLSSVTPTETETGYIYNVEGSYSHFYLIDEQPYASKNASITISYAI